MDIQDTYIYIYVHVCMCIRTCICRYEHANQQTCTNLQPNKQTHTPPPHIHTHIHTYIHAYRQTYIHTHIHIYIHTRIHTYMHEIIHIYIYIDTSMCICVWHPDETDYIIIHASIDTYMLIKVLRSYSEAAKHSDRHANKNSDATQSGAS